MKDYYQVLGLSRDSSQQEIKRIFRKMALQYHPDCNPQNQRRSEEKFKEINEAYQVLGDEDERRRYDYMIALTQRRQRFVAEDDFDVTSVRNLDEEALQQLLHRLAELGLGFDVRWGYMRGCGRRYGRRCRRWTQT